MAEFASEVATFVETIVTLCPIQRWYAYYRAIWKKERSLDIKEGKSP